MSLSENRHTHGARLFSFGFTEHAEPHLHFFIERYQEAFNAEIDAFVDAIEKGRTPEIGFEDGQLALVLAEAAAKPVAERRVVNVSEIG